MRWLLKPIVEWPLWRDGLILLLLVSLSACSGEQKSRTTFSIATGGTAGLYYPFGGGMASIWSEHLPDVNVKAEVTGGSVTNVVQVARQESEFGLAMADVVTDAFLGQGRFPEPLPLRVLLNAYPNIVHILTLADSGVTTVADLRGKRVSLGASGSGTAIAAENVVTGLGVALDELSAAYLNFGETTSALKDGTIDAGFVVGGLGLAAVTELAVTRDLVLVPLSDADLVTLQNKFPAYAGYQIPGDTYNGIPQPVQALGIWSAVVVHESMPEALAYRLTCTLFAHKEVLLGVSPVAEDMSVANLTKLAAMPLHPGTQRYLQTVQRTMPEEIDCRATDGV